MHYKLEGKQKNLLFIFSIVVLVAGFHVSNGLPLSVISETCLNGNNQRPFSRLTKLYGIAPLLLFLLVSISPTSFEQLLHTKVILLWRKEFGVKAALNMCEIDYRSP